MTTDIFEQFDGAFRPGISIDEAFNICSIKGSMTGIVSNLLAIFRI